MENTALLPIQGNYKELVTYKKTKIIYEITYYFSNTYLKKGDRTVDQMIQAARSGKQNIVEGSSVSATSTKMEIKLLNVAKASLQELLEDYEDYHSTHNHEQWSKGGIKYETMRSIGRNHNDTNYFMNIVHTRPPETIANIAIILIKQADYLLYKQLDALSKRFQANGGFSERMSRFRKRIEG